MTTPLDDRQAVPIGWSSDASPVPGLRTPESFTLAPGHAAHTTITWLPPQDGQGWTPTTIVVTPPDETRSARLDWPGGAVLRQDGATHPGTYVGPVSPGAGG